MVYLSHLSSDFNNLFLVKWNFVSQGEKQLSLEVGDTVHIQEVCDGKNISTDKNNAVKSNINSVYHTSLSHF